jgi:hypothetical protein
MTLTKSGEYSLAVLKAEVQEEEELVSQDAQDSEPKSGLSRSESDVRNEVVLRFQ